MELSEKVVRNGTLNEIIYTNKTLKNIAGEMQPAFREFEFIKPCITLDLDKGMVAVERSLFELGEINLQDFLSAKCEFKCKGATVGQKAEMQIKLFSHSKPVPNANRHFSVELSDPEDTKLTSVISTTECGYTVTFTPQMSGPHKVSGMLWGRHLPCEQRQIFVSSINPVLKFGKKGNGNGTFDRPWGLAIDNNDCLYVADFGNGLIQKFTDDGKYLGQFNVTAGNEEYTTVDMTLDLDNDQLFCIGVSRGSTSPDDGKNVLAFNLRGNILRRCETTALSSAVFIAMDTQGNLIISDTKKTCLAKLDDEFHFLCHMGTFKYPGYISIVDDGSMIVPDRLMTVFTF